jgi:hypothetical protein
LSNSLNAGGRISLIATVLNERAHLAEWLAGLEAQQLQPDEVVIVDGGSTDGTWEALQAWNPTCLKRLLQAPAATIAQGRNLAIRQSTGDIVAITDAGTVAGPDWLRLLVDVLRDPAVDVAAGGFYAQTASVWQRALAAATLPDMSEIEGARFLPSSRAVAVRREWLTAGVLYPEWLDYCEDLVWDLQLRRAGARFAFVPEAQVAFAPRSGPRAFRRQYFCYARGDGKAGLWPRRHLVRYAAYGGLIAVAVRRRPRELLLVSALASLNVAPLIRRLRRREPHLRPLSREFGLVLALALFARAFGDVAKMAGYPAGLLWRWRRHGALGPRTNWRRITPSGRLWRPE